MYVHYEIIVIVFALIVLKTCGYRILHIMQHSRWLTDIFTCTHTCIIIIIHTQINAVPLTECTFWNSCSLSTCMLPAIPGNQLSYILWLQAYQVPCPVGQLSCECPSTATACEFNLTVNYLQTFASYSLRDDGNIDPLDGYVHYINASGQVSCDSFFTIIKMKFHFLLYILGI